MKKNTGITLIALVVTIIVLIILAGISINLVLGENGIITKAKEAKQENEKATEKEAISLAIVASQMKDTTGEMVITKTNLDEALNKQLGENKRFETTDNGDGSFVIELENRIYYIEEKGNIIEEKDILKISTVEELKDFRDDVNNGNTYEGKYIYLANDITLDVNEEWEPIGLYEGSVANSKLFKGTFDGREHIIEGLRLTTSNYQSQGLFGFVYNGNIKNLKIGENCIITGESAHTGAITGFLYMNSRMYNCSNSSDIICSNNIEVGGLIGTINKNANVIKCYNTGNIEGIGVVGGVVGNNMTGIIDSCYNTGNIIGSNTSNYRVGGVVGQSLWQAEILNCYNTGDVNAKIPGGIVGKISGESTLKNCYNIGKITNAQTGDFISGMVNDLDQSNGLNFIKNNYYLENIVNEGNDTKIVEGISHKTSDELKQLYNTLGSAFKEDTNNINNGYPILSWQQ